MIRHFSRQTLHGRLMTRFGTIRADPMAYVQRKSKPPPLSACRLDFARKPIVTPHLDILSLLEMGDRDGVVPRECSDLLQWFRETTDPLVANSVAWSCVLAPDAVPDPEAPVRMAEKALKDTDDEDLKATILNTLGAALYRAGRSRRCDSPAKGGK